MSNTFYGDNKAFNATTEFDNSPLNRPREQYGAGEAWRTNNKKTQLFEELAGTDVVLYTVNSVDDLVYSGSYPSNSLYKKRIIDEQGFTSIEITDKAGKLIQKQQQDETGYITTYYIYDKRERLRAIIQPEGYKQKVVNGGNANISYNSVDFQNWIFFYNYDARGRISVKHIPAAGWTKYVYDQADRPVMQQDASQAAQSKWAFMKYDAQNRIAATGETVNASSQASLQASFDAHPTPNEAWQNGFWNGASFPNGIYSDFRDVKVFNFYDNYEAFPATMAFKADSAFHTWYPNAKGLSTGSVKRNLDPPLQDTYYFEVYYYDNNGRVIQTQMVHQKSSTNETDLIIRNFEYNFAGEMTRERTNYNVPNKPLVAKLKTYTYDHAGRKTSYSLKLGNINTKIATYEYDETGRLKRKVLMPDGTFTTGGVLDYINRTTVPTADDIAKKAICLLPGTSYTAVNGIPYSATINPNASGGTSINGLQKIDFSYHIRGGLRGINLDGSGNTTPNNIEGDLFAYKLDYETVGQWNGNIGKQYWNSNLENRNYTFTYDAASRLKSATFVGINAENYSLPQINYDKNGNILNLQRNGKIGNSFGQMDNLTYTYSGNKLTSITDAISGNNEVDFVPRGNNAYTYWPNGALKSDANEQIYNIVYNTYINQPINVSLTDGRTINSTYHGGGTLLKNTYSTGEYWEFVDDMIFKNGTLYQLMDDEGRLIYNSTTNTFTYEFDYKDHLGNSRISFKAENGTLVQTARTDFDPWGVVLKSSNTNLVQNRFELQNHEKEMTFGLNRVNFGARTLNPTTGVFDRTDRFSEKYYSLSPFQFSAGNPIRYVDINGDSLIVMSAPEGAKGAGHAAVLIGNDKTGWELYSKNGTNDAGGLKGENNKGDNRGEGKASKFKTLSDFANSKSSPQSTDKTESGKPEYQKAFLLESDSKTDEKMKLGALNVLNKDYTLLGSSCVDVCSEALKAGGFDPGKTTVLGVKLPLMYDTPNLRYIDMKNNNNGKEVTRLITPKNN